MLRVPCSLLIALALAPAHAQDGVRWPSSPRAAESWHVLFRLQGEAGSQAWMWRPGDEDPKQLLEGSGSVLDLAWWPGHPGHVLALTPEQDSYVIGRVDPASGSYPEVDLVPFGGQPLTRFPGI